MSQKTITVGTVGTPADLDTNFGNAQDNLTEGYADKATQDAAIALNTAKTGITTEQADAIVANTAKISFDAASSSKLDGIEALADVTDAANVAAAGAVMNTGNETIAGVKTFSSSPIIPAPTTDVQAATKKYVDDSMAAAGAGDITGVTAGTGLSGGGDSGSVTLNLADTAVTPGSYTNVDLTVDQQGRITAAANGSSSGTTWGSISGTLSSQSDLQAALDAKQATLVADTDYLTPGTAAATYAPVLGADDNYVTDAQLVVIGNTSGTNTGDQDISGKQDILAEGAFVDGDKTKYDNAQPSLGTVGTAGNYLIEENVSGVHGLAVPGNWKVFYTDGSGGGLKELSIGSIGTFLKSNGTGGAPEWADPAAAAPASLELTADTALSEAQLLSNKFFTNQGATGEIDVTLPAVSYRITRTIIVEEEQIIEVNPPSGEAFDLSGTMLDADDVIDSPATVGAKMVVTRMKNAAGSWHWSCDVVRGTWADSGASD